MPSREKWFRISCSHGRQSKDHDQEKPTPLPKGLGHGTLCKGDSNQGVGGFFMKIKIYQKEGLAKIKIWWN